MKLNTLSYVLGTEDTIETGREYYFGQLWDGDGDEPVPEWLIKKYEEQIREEKKNEENN